MSEPEATPRFWPIGLDRVLTLEPFVLMGVLNMTPDSFSDGARYTSVEQAAEFALQMVDEGAQIIDVGGESSRPGAQRVHDSEQVRRVAPVIARIRLRSYVAISIDTTCASVAETALEAGADIVNDISAGTDDPAMFSMVARRGAGIVLMHRLQPSAEESYSDKYRDSQHKPPQYKDVLSEVASFLLARAEMAMAAGIARDAIALDPGLGFGKTVTQNYELLARSSELAALGFPLLVGASRKSFLGAVTARTDPEQRIISSVVAAVAAYGGGARIIRAHDVGAHREALLVAHAVMRGAGM
ncbi:MAG: dihydropteroate synthase [Planctomycetota bacterium]|nr:MAG: dihydropteroate synthase [Planctomycetota bacterium]